MALKPMDSSLWDKHGGQVGDWYFTPNDREIIIRLPGGDAGMPNLAILTLQKPTVGYSGPVWQWDGNHEAPTITPSILHHSTPPWHGYLTAGKLVTA